MTSDRYDPHPDEGEAVSNKLGLQDRDVVNEREVVGFAEAEHDALDQLNDNTKFTLEYLYTLHKRALGSLYEYAGQIRTANISKGGFMFAPAHVLPQTLQNFAREYLGTINAREWLNKDELLEYLAEMHAELLFIHPFRDGNGRVIRLFTRLVFLAKAGADLDFEHITKGDNFEKYVAAVQQATKKEYTRMKELFREMQT
ncbi:MAG: Fic family protein [Minisyncoccia bacterium]